KKFFVIFGILIFYVVFIAYADFEKFSSNISEFDFSYLPIILAFIFLGIIIRGTRQQLLYKQIEVFISFKTGILLYISGLSMIVTPGGSGELIKSYYLKKNFGYPLAKTFPVVIMERLLDLAGISGVLLIVGLLLGNYNIILLMLILLSVVSLIFVSGKKEKLFNFLLSILEKIPILKKQATSFSESYQVFGELTSSKIMTKTLGLSFFVWMTDAIMIYFIFIGFNLNFDIIFSTFSMYGSLLLGVLTMVPAGVGVTEVSFVEILKGEGVDTAVSTSLVILFRLVTIWFLTALGFCATRYFLKNN
ncbi:MAG: flippase-like domain-containing protein, partial [Nitrosopumilus sp.]|nr:flippase-like domain-containing protein [Nitrosopumilus sp.]